MTNSPLYNKIDQLPTSIHGAISRMQTTPHKNDIGYIACDEQYKPYRGVLLKIGKELADALKTDLKTPILTPSSDGQKHKNRIRELIRNTPLEYDEVDIIGIAREIRGIELKNERTHYVGLCPYHHEETPSFKIDKVKGVWKCFGCGRGGRLTAGSLLDMIVGTDKKSYEQWKWFNSICSKYKLTDENEIQKRKQEIETIKKERIALEWKEKNPMTRKQRKILRYRKHIQDKYGDDDIPF